MTPSLDAQADLQRLLTPFDCDFKIEIRDADVVVTLPDAIAVQLYRPIRKIALRNGVGLNVVSADDEEIVI